MTAADPNSDVVADTPVKVESDGGMCQIYPHQFQWGGGSALAFGEFQCDSAEGGAALIDKMAAVARDLGASGLIGPMNGSTWHPYRLVTETDGTPPFFLEPQNPDYWPQALDLAGMKRISSYASSIDMSVAGRARSMGARGVSVRALTRTPTRKDLQLIHALSLEAFAERSFFRPIGFEAFAALYAPVLPLVDPSLIFIAEGEAGEAVGFLFGLPDHPGLEQNPQQSGPSGRVILKTYGAVRRGVGALLGSRFYAAARERQASAVIHALYEDTNLSAAHSRKVGGKVFRRYALWGLPL